MKKAIYKVFNHIQALYTAIKRNDPTVQMVMCNTEGRKNNEVCKYQPIKDKFCFHRSCNIKCKKKCVFVFVLENTIKVKQNRVNSMWYAIRKGIALLPV